MAEAGVPEITLVSIAGHMSRAMIERYSHIRMNAKRDAVEAMSKIGPSSASVPEKIPEVQAARTVN